jgi:hypothetical protein
LQILTAFAILGQKQTLVIYFADASGAFLTSPPGWTLTDCTLKWADGRRGRLEQDPFHWANGLWEAELRIHFDEPAPYPHRALLRIDPDTLRRWKDVGIDPQIESCAQIRDHLRRAKAGELSLLTLL